MDGVGGDMKGPSSKASRFVCGILYSEGSKDRIPEIRGVSTTSVTSSWRNRARSLRSSSFEVLTHSGSTPRHPATPKVGCIPNVGCKAMPSIAGAPSLTVGLFGSAACWIRAKCSDIGHADVYSGRLQGFDSNKLCSRR